MEVSLVVGRNQVGSGTPVLAPPPHSGGPRAARGFRGRTGSECGGGPIRCESPRWGCLEISRAQTEPFFVCEQASECACVGGWVCREGVRRCPVMLVLAVLEVGPAPGDGRGCPVMLCYAMLAVLA